MRAFLVGFPKSGTSTIQRAFVESGIRSVHWKCDLGHVGEIIYENYYSGLDPLVSLKGFDAITQADVCLPAIGKNYWPNLDFSVLATVRRYHPDCLFILNWRDPQATAASICQWGDLRERLASCDIPGLPKGYGLKPDELVRWIENHLEAARIFFRDANFLELDITAQDAPAKLGTAMGLEISWWGRENVNPKRGVTLTGG